MGYRLGVDLGTSFTAATIGRAGTQSGSPAGESAIVPSVAFIGANGEREYGTAAAERAGAEPQRVLRGFVRRIGDETPMLPEAGAATAAHRIAADFVAWVVAQASAQEGRAPEAVAVTHAAGWGPHKRELFAAALRDAGVPSPVLVADPIATAMAGTLGREHAPGAVIAVYDLGGRTFDAALVRRDADGAWSAFGNPAGLPDLGGTDLDDLVLGHVITGLSPDQQQALAQLDADDDAVTTAMAGLRAACVKAKEALSSQATVVVEVKLPGVTANVRLTRAEFEAMISPALEATVDVLDAVVDAAGLAAGDLASILIAGGSSRIPLVTQMLSTHFHRPVVTAGGQHAATAIAAGAVLALGNAPVTTTVVPTPPMANPAKRSVRLAKPSTKAKTAASAAAKPVVPARPKVLTVAAAPVAPVPPIAAVVPAVVETPAYPVVELPPSDPMGSGSKPIRARRMSRRSEIVGLEGLAASTSVENAMPIAEVPRAVIPARKVASVEALLAEEPVRIGPARPAPARVETVRADEVLPPPRPAMDDAGFDHLDDRPYQMVEQSEDGWTWRSLFSVRRSLALTVLTGAIFVGSTAWIPATPAITDHSSSSTPQVTSDRHIQP